MDLRALKIYTSPAARAYGTAGNIAEIIKHQGILVPTNEIGPMEQRDSDRATLVYEKLRAGSEYVSYEQEPAFLDSTIFEPPTEVRARWYRFLAAHLCRALHSGPRHAILVSHYEVLSNLVRDVFGIEATQATELQHAEPIYLSVSQYDNASGLVVITGKFRDQEAVATFDLFDHSIERRI
jgi:broad specificity phosphatase PhoE